MGLGECEVGFARTEHAVQRDDYWLGRFVVRELIVDTGGANLSEIIEEVTVSREPMIIRGRERNALVFCEGDWIAINEILSLLSVPGMRESLTEGIGESIGDCATGLDW